MRFGSQVLRIVYRVKDIRLWTEFFGMDADSTIGVFLVAVHQCRYNRFGRPDRKECFIPYLPARRFCFSAYVFDSNRPIAQ